MVVVLWIGVVFVVVIVVIVAAAVAAVTAPRSMQKAKMCAGVNTVGCCGLVVTALNFQWVNEWAVFEFGNQAAHQGPLACGLWVFEFRQPTICTYLHMHIMPCVCARA